MKTTLIICAGIWIGGSVFFRSAGYPGIAEMICVNIFGSITILLGLFMVARWAWRKLTGPPPNKQDRAKVEAALAALPEQKTELQSPTSALDPALQKALVAVNAAVQRELRSPTPANIRASKAAQDHYEAVCMAMFADDVTPQPDTKVKPSR